MAGPWPPASPTLTNPDMILPYGGYDDSTPSPPRAGAWSKDMDFSQGLGFGGLGSMVPITPIIYGNGTMLSDIGEVTEAESTVGGPGGIGARRLQSRLARSANTAVSSSPTLPYHNIIMAKKKAQAHKRSVSDESASTFTTETPQGNHHFKDFDDTVSVDESAFAGDDEESVVDYSYAEPRVAETRTLYSNRASRLIDMKKEEEELSSAALSRRAETILANAKKRLDNMEGNLNRARNSLIITPSTSIHSSSPLARSTPSPPARVVAQLGNQPLRHRQLGHSSLSSGHTRISSENSIPSPVLPVATSRTFLSGRPLDPSPRISAPVPKRQDSSDSFVSGRRSYSALQSRNSDPSTAATNQEGGSGSDGDIFNGHRSDRYVRAATAEPSYHHEIQHNGLERSASTTDMHDLTGKMSELKTKISTLRDKAREDMRRRSAQSLRTPSPFTAAEQWYTSSQDYRDGHLSADAGIAGNPWDRDSPSRDASPKDVLIVQNGQVNDQVFEYEPSEAETVYHEVEEVESNPSETYGNVMTSFGDADPLNKPGTPSDGEGSSGTERDDYAVDDDNESVYHDTLQVPAESHEDREDAFDYEHFFLHSAMGTMTRERMARRDSQGSYSSEDSVETTKALEPATDDYRDHLKDDPRGHHRQQSADTISTMASFATAQETFDDEEEDLINQYEESEAFPVIPLEQLQSAKQSAFSANQDAGRKTPQVVSRPTSVLSRATSVMRNGVSQPAPVHRPSISSMNSASTGITRSFSVKKPMTPTNGPSTAPTSPAQPVLDENGNELCGVAITTDNDDLQQAMPMSPNTAMLRRDEQILVERLMASMSKCVLALQESREGTVEHRLWRRRLDAARRVLEGIEGAV